MMWVGFANPVTTVINVVDLIYEGLPTLVNGVGTVNKIIDRKCAVAAKKNKKKNS